MRWRVWHGLVLAALVLVGAGLGVQAWADREGRQALDEALAGLPAEWSAEYDQVAVSLWTRRLHIFGLTVAHEDDPPLRIDELVVEDLDRDHRPPHHMRLRAVGLHGEPAEGWPVPAAEWSHDSAEWVFAYRYDPGAQSLQVDEFRLTIPGHGWVVGRLHLTRFDLEQTLTTHALRLPEFEVAGLTLRYRDQGFFRELADEGRTEPLIPLVHGWADRFEAPFFRETAEAVGLFLGEPVALELQARPAEPVPLLDLVAMAMVTPEAIPDRLEARVRALRE